MFYTYQEEQRSKIDTESVAQIFMPYTERVAARKEVASRNSDLVWDRVLKRKCNLQRVVSISTMKLQLMESRCLSCIQGALLDPPNNTE